MRTKHLLTALMLPAVFAACTQEEYDVVDNAVKMNERIELGQIALNFGSPESRFAAGTGNNYNGFVPAEGDVLGAALVDNAGGGDNVLVYDQTSVAAHKGLYTLTNAVNTNYAYKMSGNVWKSEANMVEGNYLFYLPYNASHTVRTPLVANLPVIQTLEVSEEGVVKESLIDYAIEQGSIMGVGYSFIDRGDDNVVSVKMLPVYAYPLVKLVNTYEEDITPNDGEVNPVGVDVTVKQIVVKNSENFTVSAPINAGNNTVLSATEGAVKALNRSFTYRNASNTANVTVPNGSYAAYDVEGQNYEAFTSELLGAATTTSPAIVVKPTQSFTIAAGAETEFYLVIPAENYNAETLTIEVSTNKGTFAKEIANPAIAAGKRYPLSEYVDGELIAPVMDPDGSLAIAAGKGSEYCLKLGENTQASSSIMVTTTADLVAELQNAVNAQTLNVTTLSKDVCFDAAAARAFKANTKGNFKLTVNGELTFTSGLANGTVTGKKIQLNAPAYINGDITINDQITWYFGNTDYTKDAVTVLAGNVTVASMGSMGGQMKIKAGATVTVKENTAAFGVVNEGTLNVYEDVDLKGNIGTVNVGHENATDAQALNLTWQHNFVNSATGIVNVYDKYAVDKLNNAGTVNNYGVISGLNNTGTVNNYASVNGVNSGLIDLKNVNAVVTATTGAGRIKNNIDINYDIDDATMANQTVYFEYKNETINGSLYPATGQYNTILLDNTTWAPNASQDLTGVNKATKLELKKATISIYVPGTEITLPEIDVYAGISTIKGSTEASVYHGAINLLHATAKLNFVNVKHLESAVSAEAVEDAIANGNDVLLTQNVELNETVLESAQGITIQGSSEDVVLTIKTAAANETAIFDGLNLKNLTVALDIQGKTSSHGNEWYSKMPFITGTSKFENVTFTKPIIVAADAEFINVDFTTDPSYNSYALIIAPFGQTVTMKECDFNAVRGIQISDQMLPNEMFEGYTTATQTAKPTLNISKTSFSTSEKAAIMVRNGGANINLSNVNIENVFDNVNAAWLDEDATCTLSDVTIIGGTIVEE